MQKSYKLLFIFLFFFSFFLYSSFSEGTPTSDEKSEDVDVSTPEIKKEVDPEQVELNKDAKKKKPREYEAEDDEDEFETKKKKEKEREKRRRRRYDDYDDEEEEEDDDEEDYERNRKPKSKKEREKEPEAVSDQKDRRERERERYRSDSKRERYEDYDDPEEYFERNRGREGRGERRPPPRRHQPDFDREERMRDRYRRPPMDDYPPEYRRRRDRKDDGDREKHFDEMKRRMQERENTGDHYKTDKAEKQKPVIDKYEIIFWGEEHPFLSHWISQVANMAPENGVLSNDWMRREASHIGINVDDFKNKEVDLSAELLYTGYIEYEQRLKDYDIHITNKFVPYIACRPKAKRVLEGETKNMEKKTDL